METLANYQFQPGSTVRRGDLAMIVSRVLTLIAIVHARCGHEVAGRAPARSSDVPRVT